MVTKNKENKKSIIKDRTIYLMKYNKQRLDNIRDRKAYARSISKLGEQLVETESTAEYYRNRADIRQRTVTNLRELNREKDKVINDAIACLEEYKKTDTADIEKVIEFYQTLSKILKGKKVICKENSLKLKQ